MKKIYLLFVLFTLVFENGANAQVVANDDVTVPINSFSTNFSSYIWQNDSLNGAPITYIFAVTITQLSSTHPGVNLNNGFLSVADNVPPGCII